MRGVGQGLLSQVAHQPFADRHSLHSEFGNSWQPRPNLPVWAGVWVFIHSKTLTNSPPPITSPSAEFVIGHAAPFGASSLQARFVPQVALTALPADLLFSGRLHRTSIQDGV